MALIVSLFFVVLSMGIVISGSISIVAHKQKTETSYSRYAQSAQLARAGLIECIGWFRKQTTQPVSTFNPLLDKYADPPILETNDPEIGIVRDFEISGRLWGRWEVWKEWESDPDSSRLAWRRKMQVEEVSSAHQLSSGSGWRLRSIGYVYQKNDATKPYNVSPNHVVASDTMEAEIKRLSISPPGQAAICSDHGNQVRVYSGGRVFGGSVAVGVFYPRGTGTPIGGSLITGVTPLSTTTSYDGSVFAVFGVSKNDLIAMADDVITDMADFPVPVPEYSLVALKAGSATFTSSRPLQSTAAVLYAEGDVTINAGSKSTFSGLLFVEGNLTINQPCEIKGAVICTGNITVQGGSDFADVYYDDDVLNRLRQHVGNYRMASAMRQTTPQ